MRELLLIAGAFFLWLTCVIIYLSAIAGLFYVGCLIVKSVFF